MYKPILTVSLCLLFTSAAIAQQFPPYRKLYTDPSRPGVLMDSMQIKLLKARADYAIREIARVKEEVRMREASQKPVLQSKSKPAMNATTLSNACGIKASFTPGNDTTLYTGQDISFTNTSQNADSYEWINDVYDHTYTTNYNFVPAVGITQIMLVAHMGTCTDTAVTYVVRNGTPPTDEKRLNVSYGLRNTNEWVQCMTNAKTDGYLLAGVSGLSDVNGYNSPYFVRVSETGCILWSKLLPPGVEAYLYSLISTYDSGFVVQVVLKDDIYNSYLLKLDKNGNILWTRSYRGASGLNWAGTIREGSDHSLMVMSGQFGAPDFTLTRLTEQGDFLWQKIYGFNVPHQALLNDMVDRNGFAYVVGTYYYPVNIGNNQWNESSMLFKIDMATGNLQWTRGFAGTNKYYGSNGIHFYKDGLIINGFADSLVDPVNNGWNNFASLLETDIDGNIRSGKLIFNVMPISPIAYNLIVNDDNSLQLFYSGTEALFLQPLFADLNFFLKLDANKNMVWQRYYFSSNADYLAQAVPAPLKGMAMVGQRMSSLLSPFSGFAENLTLVKVDSNGLAPDQYCYTTNSVSTIQDLAVKPYDPDPFTVTEGILQVVDQNITGTNPNSELRYNCPDYVPLCSFMKLSGAHFVCNMKDTFDFIAHKDPSCADPVKWTYDIANIKTVFQDGNKARILFNALGTYKILAEKPFPCASISDSIMVTVAPGLINFSLGSDTTLCSGDSILLRPQGKYYQYQWQDGSARDSFLVKTTGDYHLMVMDSCGNTRSDTIHVDFNSFLPIDLGGTKSICLTDSITIFPPVGRNPFNWTPVYNMVPLPGGATVFFPRQDTVYTLVVNEAGGCQRSGQLAFKVFPTQTISLGNDTAFCAGGHSLFTASGNFASYDWSTGETSNTIDVQTTGKYSVIAKDQNGCASKDTVSLTVYPLPAVQISGGTVICKDQSLILDAGSGFAGYSWQDGTRTESYNVIDTGYYRVQVTDQHLCSSADSIHIAQFAESPQKFLPSDTIVCSYLGALIQPNGDFAQYSWSTGETGKSIQVKTAGVLTLNVVDQQGCRGSDSIRIDLKNCEALVVFPNVFTPNHDGLNDIFRLKYPVHAADYNLQIFNRWGQKIFETSDPFAGWDGDFSGQHQPEGTYIWIIRYTDGSRKRQTLQGSVVLIR